MIRANLYLVLLTSVFAAGCAGSRENLAANVAAAPPLIATATTSSSIAAAAASGDAATQPNAVVDGNALSQRVVPICRDILKQGSNVIVTQCMSAEGWKTWQRREERAAQETVRMLQGGRYH